MFSLSEKDIYTLMRERYTYCVHSHPWQTEPRSVSVKRSCHSLWPMEKITSKWDKSKYLKYVAYRYISSTYDDKILMKVTSTCTLNEVLLVQTLF